MVVAPVCGGDGVVAVAYYPRVSDKGNSFHQSPGVFKLIKRRSFVGCIQPMKFLCWNCRGLGNPAKLRELKQLLGANNPDLIFLSETKMTPNDFRRVQNKCRMQNGLVVNSEGRSGGLALMWRGGMDVSIQSYSKHHIDSMVKLESNKNMGVRGFYGHANPNLRSSS
ncbi:hypothetical protein GOBAR_DD17534 [Gossypium barbadense]|nr:hypothetical protein GOBAR_DD17534 [Gossypium barbadense]